MRYSSFALGFREMGTAVTITLQGTEANVKLMDDVNFSKYRAGGKHTFYGGHYKQSPVHLTVPHVGTWHVTVDLGGYAGSVRAAVNVVAPGPR